MNECRVVFLNLPTTVHSFVRMKDGYATIVINARLSHEKQRACFLHEARHLANNDFEKCIASRIEAEAHKERINDETSWHLHEGVI